MEATRAGVSLSGRLADVCAVHYAEMVRWNAAHNLTRITEANDAVQRHYLDCLLPLLQLPPPAAFVDVGSGAGFPGLLAAGLWPDARAYLVEPSRKRASFLRAVAARLGVAVEVGEPLGGREPAVGEGAAPLVLSRATFPPGERTALFPYCAAGGVVCAWADAGSRAVWRAELPEDFVELDPLIYRLPALGERVVLRATRD